MPTDATTLAAVRAVRSVTNKCPEAARFGERLAHSRAFQTPDFAKFAFGAADCDTPEYYGHPDCVFAWLEFQEGRVASLVNDLARAEREGNKALQDSPALLQWRNNFLPSWNERSEELRESVQRKQSNLEPLEGPPDDPTEDATEEHNELNDWARQIAKFQRDFQALGVRVTPAEFKPEEPSGPSPIQEASSLVGNIALLGGVAVAAYLVVTLSKSR